jgi:TnpA family transposase
LLVRRGSLSAARGSAKQGQWASIWSFAAIILWNTVYLEQAVAVLERQGTPVPRRVPSAHFAAFAGNTSI